MSSGEDNIDYKVAYFELKALYEAQSAQLKLALEELSYYKKQVLDLQNEVASLKQETSYYKEQCQQLRQARFGRRTERSQSLGLPSKAGKKRNRVKKKVGRQADTSQLPRYKETHSLPESEQSCSECGQRLEVIGETVTERLETLAHPYFVKEQARPKYVCRHCSRLKQARRQLQSPLPKSFAGNSLIADVIIKKYHYHQPLYRQSQQFHSQGLALSDRTLSHWVMRSADQLSILSEAFWTELLSSDYLQVDESPVQVLCQKKKGYIWVYLSPSQSLVCYDYQSHRGGQAVEDRLRSFKGSIQSDGYSGYHSLRQWEQIEGFGCMSHSRRKFVDVLKVSGGAQGVASQVVKLMKSLYAIEKIAREKQLTAEEREGLRKNHAPPLLDSLLSLLKSTQAPPQSGLGKAVSYTLNQWSYLTKYVDYGQVEIDNNAVENAIRPFALGRRNWLFLGHHESGKHTGLLYSLIKSAQLNDLPPYSYLHYLLTRVHDLRRRIVDPISLLPHRIDHEKLSAFSKQHLQSAQKAFNATI